MVNEYGCTEPDQVRIKAQKEEMDAQLDPISGTKSKTNNNTAAWKLPLEVVIRETAL